MQCKLSQGYSYKAVPKKKSGGERKESEVKSSPNKAFSFGGNAVAQYIRQDQAGQYLMHHFPTGCR